MTGCAAQQPVLPVVTNSSASEVACAALVFDAPITLDEQPIDLSRSYRGPAAFVGYQDVSVSYYDVFTNNRESTGHGDRYYRDSFSEQTGSLSR